MFRKYRFNNAQRPSAEDLMTALRNAQGANPTFEWHLPLDNAQGFKDNMLQFTPRPPGWQQYAQMLRSRLDARVANSSKFCTAARMKVPSYITEKYRTLFKIFM